ncbi:hypothetical protein OUZ56_022594 [Daphnia magna]|uniref:carnosine N-methyltransferase n=1 Tax=Daphnia magna TaxID=35525 RepID=A0ABR0AWW0_9CRUS|nr:hypothetical protein OUZ56_022594 [Daphnia magna]
MGNNGPADDVEEKEHFQRIVNAFRYYRSFSLQRLASSDTYVSTLPQHHQKLLTSYRSHLEDIRTCVEHNYEIIKLITADVATLFENVKHDAGQVKSKVHPTMSDMEKVQSTLKQIVRDWSKDGEQERAACYDPIIEEIEHKFPPGERALEQVQILVPGAGLGRLAFEIAKRGYSCQGNEFSLFMLFASNFVLNKCQGVETFRVYPWTQQFVNTLSAADVTRGSSFPDLDPSSLPRHAQFSMAAGDFLEVYTEANTWDCIATCFFIDCANNIVSFIETIYKILKNGGIWINLGPLLYHYSDIPGENSIEPTYEMVREIVQGLGFIIEKEQTGVKTTYSQNVRSMLKYEYESVFFVCRKP